ncbi:MAG: copper chaperone PCu(A)C [Gemmatimonadota bacterium]|nr:copper chaperone PCu(A)C [Gemmatimonadota bacterium]
MPRRVPMLLVLAPIALVACGRERPLAEAGGVSVVRGWAYPSTAGLAGAYLVLTNHGPAPDTLTRLSGPEVGDASMHGVRREGVSSMMYPLEQLEIPAGGRVAMQPGGIHIMLSELARELGVGDTIMLELALARAGLMAVRLPVISYGEIPE